MAETDVSQAERIPLSSLFGLMLRPWKYRLILVASIIGYWILYSFSAGMFQYYSFDLAPLLKTSPVPNPYFFVESRSLTDLYNSGMVWYPTNHLQVNLLYGPTFFSILLSILFGLNMMLFGYSLGTRATTRSLGLNGLAGIVPALFSGSCCAVPFGTVLLTSFVSTTALSTFEYRYVVTTNSVFAALMLFALLYSARKVGSCCTSPSA